MAEREDIITAQSRLPTLAMRVGALGVDLGHCGYPHADAYLESAQREIADVRADLDLIERVVTAELARRTGKAA